MNRQDVSQRFSPCADGDFLVCLFEPLCLPSPQDFVSKWKRAQKRERQSVMSDWKVKFYAT
jgi:hypothetical protein